MDGVHEHLLGVLTVSHDRAQMARQPSASLGEDVFQLLQILFEAICPVLFGPGLTDIQREGML
ncbi:hypothetical protein, partial [Deinococcus sp. 14RED07]|uniref:hypothetical protein n=1 Tax=Deinococcus sp. 14RED07 TaxID=2745874 RepID=UPI001E4E65B6